MSFSVRTPVSALVAFVLLAALPVACQSGGVGDPCTPEEEQSAGFSGFDVRQNYIESRSFQCATRICIVNHFQGRVSCPLGQPPGVIKDCGGAGGPHPEKCDATRREKCIVADTLSLDCDPAAPSNCTAFGADCDPDRKICVCNARTAPPDGYHCGPSGAVSLPQAYLCHVSGDCQRPDADPATNTGKPCCVPGSDTPVTAPVCGQCAHGSHRDADQAVYCSCRCGVADGDPDEPDFNFCKCPQGFTCTNIRPDFGMSDQLTGKYCIKEGSAYNGTPASCGVVAGYAEMPCNGIGE